MKEGEEKKGANEEDNERTLGGDRARNKGGKRKIRMKQGKGKRRIRTEKKRPTPQKQQQQQTQSRTTQERKEETADVNRQEQTE